MLKRALIALVVVAVAAPGLAAAKGKKAAEEAVNGPAAPIPYSQLAEEDAKLNAPASHAKHHAAKKKVSKEAAQAGSAESAPAK
jgi:hypothetical protein